MRRAAALCAAVLLASAAAPALAEPPPAPDRPLTDPTQEARARALFGDIRCVVCQHESIADSPAGIAADLRGLVREQIAAGKTDAQIKDDLIRRYGDYVLFQPPVRLGTWLLWFGPFALAAGAGVVLVLRARRRGTAEAAPLTAEEERALAELTADDENA
ncbi:cytochrome c-type biogenesis protein CcmH [Chakrabartia godavariana]|nr:cytochrome c-type biogenesis protein CcmH [Chakrabartia godavariana]